MRPKSLVSFGYVLILASLSILPAAFGQEHNSSDSSLADIARQLSAQRAGSGLTSVRTFTNDNLPSTSGSSPGKNGPAGSLVGGVASAGPSGGENVQFRPVEPEGVADIIKPTATFGHGATVLDVMISEKGEVENIEVRRALPSLTDVAMRSVQGWTFQPAQEDGRAVPSRITVAVSYNAESYLVSGEANLPLPALIHQSDEARIQSAYQPPEVTLAPLPAFPSGAFAPGTVILRATVNAEGKPRDITVLRDAPPFAPVAIHAAERWRFIPATLNGVTLSSTVILAFVFSPPIEWNH